MLELESTVLQLCIIHGFVKQAFTFFDEKYWVDSIDPPGIYCIRVEDPVNANRNKIGEISKLREKCTGC